MVQPYLLNLILRAIEGETTITSTSQALPLRSIALALPQAYYTLPARLVSTTSEALGIQPSVIFTTTMTPGDNRQMAYFYATIAFFCQLLRAQSNLQHLYYSRRASIRAQSELIGSIYEKTLVRKDITGVVASDAVKRAKGKGDNDGAKIQAVQSADVGKIVSLIATDATSSADAANTFTVSTSPSSRLVECNAQCSIVAVVRSTSIFRRVCVPALFPHGLDGFHWLHRFPVRDAC